MANEQPGTRHDNPIKAVVAGLADRVTGRQNKLEDLAPTTRLDGYTALVTGANSGLGKSVAIGLARQGARVLMACRGGHPEAGEEVRAESGNRTVEMLKIDLADLRSVEKLLGELQARDEHLDIVVPNAGIMPRQSRRTEQGLELMFGVNYLGHYMLLEGLLERGLIRSSSRVEARPRIVIVSSEAHRTGHVDLDCLGEYVEYGMRDGMKQYAHTKLLLCTYATTLAQRLQPDIAVHSMCPGPVRSNITRESPDWAKPLLLPVTALLFNAPERAALPVLHLASSPELEQQTGLYYHMATPKAVSDWANSSDNGQRLATESRKLLDQLRGSDVSRAQ